MHLDVTHTVSLREWGGGYLCSVNIPEGAGGSILHVNRWWGAVRFGLESFTQLFSSNPSLCWVTTFTPHLRQPLPGLSSLCSSAVSDLPRPCDDMGPGNGRPVWPPWPSAVPELCCDRRFHVVPHLTAELPLGFISCWLISLGWIPESWTGRSMACGSCLSAFRKPETMKGAISRDHFGPQFSPHSWQCWGPVLFAR